MINDDSLKIKGNDSPGASPFNEGKTNKCINENINKGEPTKVNTVKKKENFNFSNYENYEKREDLIIYKYSKKERVSKQKLVYQYFYDDFNPEDYNDACVILFCGKTGDGKTTAGSKCIFQYN